MSNSAQVDGPITVYREGVSVEKEFAEDEEFPIPTVRFSVSNDRDDAVEVRVSDTENDVTDLAADVEEFQEWRDELGEMFQ